MMDITILEQIKGDFINNFLQMCSGERFDSRDVHYSLESIRNLFDLIISFQKAENDKTTQKAIALEIISNTFGTEIPCSKDCFFESPIEYLMFTALQKTMPYHISQQAFLLPQVPVCDKKYRLDIGLMKRSFQDDKEGNLLIGIECDGYDYHFDNKSKATATMARVRDIKMNENIEVFQYTGSEIYKDPLSLATAFWEYAENNIFPKPMTDIGYDWDAVYGFVSKFIEQPQLVSDFYVYEYEHIDVLDFMLLSDAVLGKYKGYDELIAAIKQKLAESGWEGDGDIQLLWFPPFCISENSDTYGEISWFVKQFNNGTSFICSPYELNFPGLYS